MEDNELKVTVKKFDVDWLDIKNACRQTIAMGDSQKEPSEEWKRNLLTCRHSPLRLGTVLVKIENIRYCNAMHLVRHNVGCTPFVQTSRADRTGVPREQRKQTDLVNMQMVFNVESLLNISEKRLCTCADKYTIMVWKKVLEAIKEHDENIYWACVPQCIRCSGCVEPFGECHYFENFAKDLTKEELMDVQTRYDKYNEFRERGKVRRLTKGEKDER